MKKNIRAVGKNIKGCDIEEYEEEVSTDTIGQKPRTKPKVMKRFRVLTSTKPRRILKDAIDSLKEALAFAGAQ